MQVRNLLSAPAQAAPVQTSLCPRHTHSQRWKQNGRTSGCATRPSEHQTWPNWILQNRRPTFWTCSHIPAAQGFMLGTQVCLLAPQHFALAVFKKLLLMWPAVLIFSVMQCSWIHSHRHPGKIEAYAGGSCQPNACISVSMVRLLVLII